MKVMSMQQTGEHMATMKAITRRGLGLGFLGKMLLRQVSVATGCAFFCF